MRRRIERFQLLLKLAERKRKEADRLLGESQQRVEQAEKGLEQLKAYQLEYQQQFTDAGRGGLTCAQLQTYQAFIGKVSGAGRQQQEALLQSRAQLEQVEAYWRKTQAHYRAMQKLLEKAQKDKRLLDEKRLQQQLDERSQHTPASFI
ncbi:hypothetical protein GCM10011352_37070 [Marinobacterium zhoushanense]|uniref:Flagellar FliJ protein n=1 Tax=Marinobacterium zhoushanense TaxID=1679163 RepID=A0ABQ1KU64_9GAMM|nr:flagellar export protein FliJ [Marinobacterium zhoushanense]GGC07338.1 hypothetical protein GCM10011352_37070 [Marinobacterium zhoushanense]